MVKTLIDMHTHSHYSDGKNSIQEIIKLIKKKNIGIAVTDHNEIKGAIEALKYKDTLIIPGIEVGSLEGRHILLYFYDVKELKEFYDKHIKRFHFNEIWFNFRKTCLKTTEIIDIALDYNCIIAAAHPYHTYFRTKNWNPKVIPNMKKIHAIEILNSVLSNRDNKMAGFLARDLNKVGIAGTDGHEISLLGKAGIETNETSIEGILNAIRKNKIKIKGRILNYYEYHKQAKQVIKSNILPIIRK